MRLSIDEYIWAHFGRFGVDYPPSRYERWKQEAEQASFEVFEGLLRAFPRFSGRLGRVRLRRGRAAR